MKQNNRTKIGTRVSLISIVVNVLLSLAKFIFGFLGHSAALISDGVHSASDVISSIIVIIGIRLSSKKADTHHQYGHERIECVASIILSQLLFLTGLGIGYTGIKAIFWEPSKVIQIPALITLIMAFASIVIKELMYQFTKFYAKKINSSALMADAWHHRSDALSSIASLIGIFFARMGYLKMDSISSAIISIFILKVAYDIFKDSIDKMIDESCSKDEIKKLTTSIMETKGVYRLDDLKSRKFGNRAYIDIEISCDGNLKLYEAHSIAEKVHAKIEKEFPDIKHCMVHVNPISKKKN